MTDWAVIGIIVTILVMGLTIIGIQMTTFIYLLRRMDAISDRIDERIDALHRDVVGVQLDVAGVQRDVAELQQDVRALQKDIAGLQQDVGEVKERVARIEGILIGRLEVGNGTLTQTGDD